MNSQNILQVQLLFCHYGWPIEKIAAQVGLARSVVKLIISDNQWEAPKDLMDTTNLLPGDAKAISWLKERELDKQSLISPLLALAEIELVGKIAQAIQGVDASREDAHTVISHLVKAYKTLSEGAVSAHIALDSKENPGIAIQVVNNM